VNRKVGHVPFLAAERFQAVAVPRANEAFAPLPAPTGKPPYRLPLSYIAGDPTDTLSFVVIGDSGGIVDAAPQEAVAAALAAAPAPRFVYHVGDWVYFNGDASQWFPQFYEPYDHTVAPFVGIPGNHDGWNLPGSTSLEAWMTNVCAPAAVLTSEAGDSNRDAMTLPNCYWTLDAALVTIIGLYTNVPSGGVVDATQAAWLLGELRDAPTGRPVIVTLHHPPYSADAMHGGSAEMGKVIDDAATAAGRWPDMVISGHVHDYQRWTRTVDGKAIPYIVCGASGYRNLHPFAADVTKFPWASPDPTVILEGGIAKSWGFLTLTVTPGKISGVYTAVSKAGAVTANADTFTVTT
jgi:hypothetical protein